VVCEAGRIFRSSVAHQLTAAAFAAGEEPTLAVTDLPTFIRADGPDKVTGSGRYTADMTLTGMLVAKFKYSAHSHARITKLDVSAARAIPGVFAVLTQDDVPDVHYTYGIADRTLFAQDVVRFEGEVIAAVAATTAAIAEQALDAIVVEYEPLPVVTDLAAALEDDAQLVHENWEDLAAGDDIIRKGNLATFSSIHKGDPDEAMARADHVITSRYEADASHALPIEPRAIVAQWEGDKVTIWTSTQVPYDARDGVCETLELPANRVRIIVPHLGGGFGGKCGFHFEAHIAALAQAAARPVKLVFSRYEEFIAPDRRREGMIFDITTGVMADGTIVARTGEILVDNGAYLADSAFFPQVAAMHIAGPYKMEALRIVSSLVYTNKQPSGSVRAPTAPQGCWALESHTDEVAAAIGMDPIEFRRLNVVRTGEEGPVGQVYEEIGLVDCLNLAVESASSVELGENEALGVAVGWWPSFAVPTGAFAKMHGDGSVQVITGAQECGTGSVMTLRMIVADELGIDQTDVQLVYQDTGAAPVGPGATGSQTLFNHGRAVETCAKQIGEQLRDLAAGHLEAAAADIVLGDGNAFVAGTPTKSVSIVELAGEAAGGDLLLGAASAEVHEYPELPSGACVGDQGMGAWMAPQFSCHVARVRLDPDTGVARVLEVHTAHDSGTILNPVGAHGQIEGGVLMGIGQALTEGTKYDEDGKQLNAALLEYKLQTIADAPSIHTQFVEINTPNAGPKGSKGLAEAPNVATAGAISNALAKLAGTRIRQMPMTSERVWEAMHESNQGGAA
jgi:CO/xanthine dehydrogenase Mo-binding subunit